MVVDAILQIVGQALHVGDFLFQVVRVLISLAIADCLHQAGWRVSQMQRHRVLRGSLDIFLHRAVGGVERI